jgi:hypothetical protein
VNQVARGYISERLLGGERKGEEDQESGILRVGCICEGE